MAPRLMAYRGVLAPLQSSVQGRKSIAGTKSNLATTSDDKGDGRKGNGKGNGTKDVHLATSASQE
jgi:hypothetical protein